MVGEERWGEGDEERETCGRREKRSEMSKKNHVYDAN